MKDILSQNDYVNIATFDKCPDGEKLKSFLQCEGVDARVQDETRLEKYWFMVSPRAAIHVRVPSHSLMAAQKLLTQPKAAHFLKKVVRCPSCGSFKIQYPDLTRKNLLPTLFVQALVLLHIKEHKHYCENCHFNWLRPLKNVRRHNEKNTKKTRPHLSRT